MCLDSNSQITIIPNRIPLLLEKYLKNSGIRMEEAIKVSTRGYSINKVKGWVGEL